MYRPGYDFTVDPGKNRALHRFNADPNPDALTHPGHTLDADPNLDPFTYLNTFPRTRPPFDVNGADLALDGFSATSTPKGNGFSIDLVAAVRNLRPRSNQSTSSCSTIEKIDQGALRA